MRLSLIHVFPLLAAALSPATALAEDAGRYPVLEGTLDLKSYSGFFFDAGDEDGALNGLSAKAGLGLKLSLTPIFSINSDIVLEPVLENGPGTFKGYDDIGLYAEALYLQADLGAYGLLAGKYNPSFGRAWDNAPGVFATKLAEEYQLTEMWGLAGWHKFEAGPAGTYTLTGNVFYADTTFLSESLITNRGRTHVADGGPANTGRLNSFSVTMDGEEISALPGFSFNLGYRHLAAGRGDNAAEDGFVAGFEQAFDLARDVKLGLVGEFVYLSHAFATPDDATYATVGLKLERGPWHGEVTGTLRNTRFADGGSGNDYLAQLSGGYTFGNGLDASLAFAAGRNDGADTHVIGVRLSKSFDFKLGG